MSQFLTTFLLISALLGFTLISTPANADEPIDAHEKAFQKALIELAEDELVDDEIPVRKAQAAAKAAKVEAALKNFAEAEAKNDDSKNAALNKTAAALPVQPTSSDLLFSTSDKISGEILEVTDTHITLRNKQFPKDLHLKTDKLDTIQLSQTSKTTPKADKPTHTATLTLKPRFNQTVGDTLHGMLGQITDKEVTLHTPYAGTLKIKRSLILNLDISANASIYSPPHNEKDWIKHGDKNSWIFKNNDLIGGKGNGTIAHDCKLPDACVLSTDVDWKSNMDINIIIFSNDINNAYPSHCYSLSIRNNYAYMRKSSTNQNNISMEGAKSIQEFIKHPNTAKIDLYMDKTKGTFHLYIEGVEAGVFRDPQPNNKEMGGAIHLSSNQGSSVRYRNLHISPWSGSLPNTSQDDSKSKLTGDGQRILLQNGDSVFGTIENIEDEILTIETKFAKVAVPVIAMRSVLLKETKPDAPKMAKNDVKAHFRDGGWVILGLENIKDGKLKGYHQGFGSKTFDLSAFSFIEFNINDPKASSVNADQDW